MVHRINEVVSKRQQRLQEVKAAVTDAGGDLDSFTKDELGEMAGKAGFQFSKPSLKKDEMVDELGGFLGVTKDGTGPVGGTAIPTTTTPPAGGE